MATRTTLLRMKAIRKFGQPFWPWRRLNSKQVKIVAKVYKKSTRQAKGQDMKRKKSQFFHHIRARKLMALLYGKLHTSYLLTLFKKSTLRKGKTISNFFAALETRLDTTLYRVQFAPTLQAARQLITHQKICVNNVILTKPGHILQPGDVISVAPNDVEFVGQSIQHFLRAGNTSIALRTVGLLRKFRATRRRRNKTTKKMGIAPKKKNVTLPKRAVRVIKEMKYKKARKTNTQRKVHFTKHTGTSNTSTAQKITLTKIKRAQMLLKMRRHMMQTKRNKRLTLRVTKHCLKRQEALHAPYSLLTKRPRRHTRLRMVRFQRTAKGMPVKAWVNTVFKNMPVRTKNKKRKKIRNSMRKYQIKSRKAQIKSRKAQMKGCKDQIKSTNVQAKVAKAQEKGEGNNSRLVKTLKGWKRESQMIHTAKGSGTKNYSRLVKTLKGWKRESKMIHTTKGSGTKNNSKTKQTKNDTIKIRSTIKRDSKMKQTKNGWIKMGSTTKRLRKKFPFRFVTKKVFYKPTHVEVNYHTLHIVYLHAPHYVYFPIKLALQHIASAFQR